MSPGLQYLFGPRRVSSNRPRVVLHAVVGFDRRRDLAVREEVREKHGTGLSLSIPAALNGVGPLPPGHIIVMILHSCWPLRYTAHPLKR
jgi:hypothetical protein